VPPTPPCTTIVSTPRTTYYWQVRAVNPYGTTYANGGSTAFWTYGTGTQFIVNGDFSNDISGWQLFATPSVSYILWFVTGGVFEFYRYPPPAGTTNQAAIFQTTGFSLPQNAPLTATFHLGNGDNVRKRISVLLVDADFSDLSVCTFWIPPNTSLFTYSMTSRTTKPWNNASIYFYAASAGTNNGLFYLLDNVSLQTSSGPAAQETVCHDPYAPGPTGQPPGPNLLTNGDFGSGALAPGWGTFGPITTQVSNFELQFIRPSSALPSGVVLQATGQVITARAILRAGFSLGNSSTVRKRVTVILHDNNFTDLSACTSGSHRARGCPTTR
jgi:hypothetical protein